MRVGRPVSTAWYVISLDDAQPDAARVTSQQGELRVVHPRTHANVAADCGASDAVATHNPITATDIRARRRCTGEGQRKPACDVPPDRGKHVRVAREDTAVRIRAQPRVQQHP